MQARRDRRRRSWTVRALGDALARESLQPLGFTRAHTALAMLAEHGVDVVVTAQVVTEMDGTVLVRTLRGRDGESVATCTIRPARGASRRAAQP